MARSAGDERLSFLTRPTTTSFARRVIVIPPGGSKPYRTADWRGAIACVESGLLALDHRDGDTRVFDGGDLLCLQGLALRALRNPGHRPTVLVAIVRRTDARPPPVAGGAGAGSRDHTGDEADNGDNGDMNQLLDALPVPHRTRMHFDFLLTAHRLTEVVRVNRLLDGTRGETSAEHSWHLALAAVVLADDHAPEVDIGRVVTMLIIHDLVEVETGDVPIYDERARIEIAKEEERAAARLFGRLPVEEGDRLSRLWHEFEDAETGEARFARAIDRLQPLLLHWASDGAAWAERAVTVDQERRIMDAIGRFWPSLATTAHALIDDAHERGMLAGPMYDR